MQLRNEKANDTPYGLSSAIFSNDEDKAREYALDMIFGMTPHQRSAGPGRTNRYVRRHAPKRYWPLR
ncbi:MAG TPA: aldehyde dehydrogenase family protein [Lentibacillus sp.]|uniref:aldehyde dehydrogenase family protein n=1 Tax=Lentibacillus sp. TaxID=1925746 RepID=UPI002B4B151B|nr:aldehyde dehydrogenase family protein [Lentibacillus sp.]HLR63499.1 aldehyde dehydrogenase family protein [Lentibacillus sp.]